MPLIRFLSYYHVLEHYFRISAGRVAVAVARRHLSNPAFSYHNEQDIMGLIDTISSVKGDSRAGDERAQLISVVRDSVQPAELCSFIANNSAMKEFFYGGKDWKKVVDVRVGDDEDAIIKEVSRRIYEIRCAIVHQKDSISETRLVPQSSEASMLRCDISLVEYVATQALHRNSLSLDGVLRSAFA